MTLDSTKIYQHFCWSLAIYTQKDRLPVPLPWHRRGEPTRAEGRGFPWYSRPPKCRCPCSQRTASATAVAALRYRDFGRWLRYHWDFFMGYLWLGIKDKWSIYLVNLAFGRLEVLSCDFNLEWGGTLTVHLLHSDRASMTYRGSFYLITQNKPMDAPASPVVKKNGRKGKNRTGYVSIC